MWLKLLLAGLSVAFCTLLGYLAAEKYRARKRFFTAMNTFNEKYLSELRFSRKPLPVFLKENHFSGEFATMLTSYPERKTDVERYFLTAEERQQVKNYFEMLGRGDSHTQSGFFEAQQPQLAEAQKSCEKEAKERGALYLKLGLLAGFAFVILIL